jgi:AmiR/NasT family two-component response regulator
MKRVIREAKEVMIHPENILEEEAFSLNRS